MGISAKFCPFFGHFRSEGPSVLLLELAREVMMGPRTGNAQKTGKTKAEMGIFHPQKLILTQIDKSSTHILFSVPRTSIVLGYPNLVF